MRLFRESGAMRVSAVCVVIGWLFASAAGAQAPAGAPAGTYNAAASTSGAFTGDDSLYAGNPGFSSRFTGVGSEIISYKRIVVTEASTFWGVTGNGTFIDSSRDPEDLGWVFTVDPFDASLATTDPTVGSVANEELTVAASVLRGIGFAGGTSEDYELLLNPLDGVGVKITPGEYYVSVWGDSRPFSSEWFWNELSTAGVPSDIAYIDVLHAPGQFGLVTDFQSLGRDMKTGDLGFDVWMTPVGCAGDLDGDGAVGSSDLAVLLAAWGTDGADLDGDGVTDSADLAVLLAAWGEC